MIKVKNFQGGQILLHSFDLRKILAAYRSDLVFCLQPVDPLLTDFSKS